MTKLWPLVVFMLASFVGLGVIRRVSCVLHAASISLTNVMSAIAVVGAIVVAGGDEPSTIGTLAAIAVISSLTSIVSRFLITDRTLSVFKGRDRCPEEGPA